MEQQTTSPGARAKLCVAFGLMSSNHDQASPILAYHLPSSTPVFLASRDLSGWGSCFELLVSLCVRLRGSVLISLLPEVARCLLPSLIDSPASAA
jgi:hypothetical protein